MRKKKALYNLITSIILQVVSITCGLIVPRLFISTYGSEMNGLVNSITQFLAYIALLEAGFGPVVLSVLYKPIANKDKKRIEGILKYAESFFRKISLIFVIYIAALCFIYPIFIDNKFGTLFTISLIIIISLSNFSEYFLGLTYSLYLQADQRKYVISTIRFVTTIINTIVTCILIKNNCNVLIIKLVGTLICILRPIIQYLYVKNKLKINLKNVTEKEVLKERWDGLSQHIAGTVYSNTDVTLLSFFDKMSEVSVYSVYNLIITAIRNFISILTGSVEAGFGDMIAREEKENLNKKFNVYEFIYFSVITIIYSCTSILIVQFVKLYTEGITDANYIRYSFAFVLVSAAFIHSIKSVYNTLAFSAGKFKETHIGSWVEAGSNFIISFALVFKLGITGVALGTLVSVSIRCIEFIIYTSKNVLNRSVKKTVFRVLISIIQYSIIYCIGMFVFEINPSSYMSWIYWGFVSVLVSLLVIVPVNAFVYKKEFKYLYKEVLKKIKKVV